MTVKGAKEKNSIVRNSTSAWNKEYRNGNNHYRNRCTWIRRKRKKIIIQNNNILPENILLKMSNTEIVALVSEWGN